MLKLSPTNEVWWRIDVPDRDDNGELVAQPVRFRLRIYTRTELKARAAARIDAAGNALAEAMRAMLSAKSQDDVAAAREAIDAAGQRLAEDDQVQADDLRARIVGWNADDITGEEDGQPVEFSEQLRDALLADEARFEALRAGLLEASRGARAKNSLPGPAGSRVAAQAGVINGSGATPGLQ